MSTIIINVANSGPPPFSKQPPLNNISPANFSPLLMIYELDPHSQAITNAKLLALTLGQCK